MGNRLAKSDSVSGSESYTFNAANMLLSRAGNSYTNDADGNTLIGGGRSMTWDAQNRMASCTKGAVTSSFTYGADGLRRQMTANGTTTDYVLDNSMFVRERNHATGASIATYLVGARGPEYRRDDVAGTVRWYLYDGLGSVLGEVDPTGAVTSSRKYDVYGAVRGGVNPGGTSRHKFVGSLGHPSDDETGLIYMRARYYDPAVGRFVNQDRARHGHNWFAYANEAPTNFVDKTGNDADLIEVSTAAEISTEFMTGFLEAVAEAMGESVEVGAEAFEVEGQELIGNARYVARCLEIDLNLGEGEFQSWAIRTMGQAGQNFVKAWMRVNVQQEEALRMLLGDEGEVFLSHATPYLGGLVGY